MNAEAKEFCRLCVEGMLFEVQAWIGAGKVVPLDADCDTPPLVLAAGKGFHSLVVMLLERGPNQDVQAAALAGAAAGGHLSVCHLLLGHGALSGAVQTTKLLESGDPVVVDLLVEGGLDIETGYPLARAMANRSKLAVAFFKRWKRKKKTVRYQGAMALRHYVREGNEQWATMVKQAGADARRRVLSVEPKSDFDGRFESTALYEAAASGTFTMLLRMGIRKSDNFEELLDAASHELDKTKIMHIIGRFGYINSHPAVISAFFQRCLHALGSYDMWLPPRTQSRVSTAWELLEEMAKAGVKWEPDREKLKDARLFLKHASPRRCVDVIRLLLEHKVTRPETVKELFSTTAMKKRLSTEWEDIQALFRMGRENSIT